MTRPTRLFDGPKFDKLLARAVRKYPTFSALGWFDGVDPGRVELVFRALKESFPDVPRDIEGTSAGERVIAALALGLEAPEADMVRLMMRMH